MCLEKISCEGILIEDLIVWRLTGNAKLYNKYYEGNFTCLSKTIEVSRYATEDTNKWRFNFPKKQKRFIAIPKEIYRGNNIYFYQTGFHSYISQPPWIYIHNDSKWIMFKRWKIPKGTRVVYGYEGDDKVVVSPVIERI